MRSLAYPETAPRRGASSPSMPTAASAGRRASPATAGLQFAQRRLVQHKVKLTDAVGHFAAPAVFARHSLQQLHQPGEVVSQRGDARSRNLIARHQGKGFFKARSQAVLGDQPTQVINHRVGRDGVLPQSSTWQPFLVRAAQPGLMEHDACCGLSFKHYCWC